VQQQQPLVSGGIVFAACVKAGVHILNKVFDTDIALIASFVTAVDNSSSYEPTGLSFFVISVHSAVVK